MGAAEEIYLLRDYRPTILYALFLLIPSILFTLFLCRSPSLDVTQIRGHKTGSCPPSPLRYALSFYRGKTSALCPLVDSRRIVRTHAIKRFRQLVSLENRNAHSEV